MHPVVRFIEDVRLTPDPVPALSVIAAIVFLLGLVMLIFHRPKAKRTEDMREADLRELFRLKEELEQLPPGFSEVDLAAVSALNKQRNMIQALREKESAGESNPAPGVLK